VKPQPGRSSLRVARGLLAILLLAPAALAQQSAGPRIGYAFPAGGRSGSEFIVTVGGQSLTGVSAARVSGSGVSATVIEHIVPLTQQQAARLRDQLKELMDKRLAALGSATQPATRPVWTSDDERTIAEIRQKLATYQRRPSSPAIAETVTLRVNIAPDAAAGWRELRLLTAAGFTNPLVFGVDQYPEHVERESGPSAAPAEEQITLPAIVNGRIMPGDVDRYRFRARRGQNLLAIVAARRLMPYLADGVPGWFQATLTLYDAAGRELAYADDYRFDPDPVLHCVIPADGEYVIEIKDSIYRGREDFVYRIALGELPFVTGVFPLGGRAGQRIDVSVYGWNLPLGRVMMDARELAPGIHSLAPRLNVPFAVDELPESTEQEPNNSTSAPQLLELPAIINGRIAQPGDRDVFCFDGREGDRIVAEVLARRLGSPLDSVLILTDGKGTQLAFNDDFEDKGAGLITHHADSLLSATLPAAGRYYVHLADVQDKGGTEYAYRLRISPPRPDFALRVVPSSLSVRGGTALFTVHALRADGFAGPIDLTLKNAPSGFTLDGARIPAGQDSIRMTLSVANAAELPASLMIEGRADIGGRTVTRPALPADEMMQAFAYRHLVCAQELVVAPAGRLQPRVAVRVLTPVPVKLPAGGEARIRVTLPPAMLGNTQLELSEPPDGVTLGSITSIRGGLEFVIRCEARRPAPGTEGNLIVNVLPGRASTTRPQAAQNVRRAPIACLPAIPFVVTAPTR